MSTELRTSIVVRLPDDAQQQAAVAQVITAAWATFLESVRGHETQPELSIGPVREAAPATRLRRRGRPPRLVEPQPAA